MSYSHSFLLMFRIIGDDFESIAHEAEKLIGCRVLALCSEGFGGDFRSGYEDAYKLIMELMKPPKTKMKGTINILGARWGPTPTEFNWDMDEIERLLGEVGIKINAIITGIGNFPESCKGNHGK